MSVEGLLRWLDKGREHFLLPSCDEVTIPCFM